MNYDLESAESFEDLYENAPCGYLSFLSDGRIVKINATLLSWLGRERGDVVSRLKVQDLLSVGEQIFFETQFSPLLQMQGAVEEIQFSLVTSSKLRIPVLTSTKQILFGADKSPLNRMTVFSISERKKYETELKLERKKAEMAAKAKSEFLTMLSHEIRTPLNAVIGVSNLLDSTTLSAEQAPFMEMLRSSSDNLMNLLNSILDLSKIEAGHFKLERKEFHPKKLVESNLLAWQSLAHKKGLNLSVEIDSNIPGTAIGDPVKLTQILNNLLGNSLKFTEKGSVVLRMKLLSSNQKEMMLRFQIQDSGIGIPEEKLALIFEEFHQAEEDTSARFGGTGLGLSISQKLANLFGSRIEVKSVLGEGSTFGFDVVLPLGDPNANTHGIERVANQTNALAGLFVLVADDSEDNLALMRHLFKKWGATVVTAMTGQEALEQVRLYDFDVVLMDVRMPVLSGYDAALAIRQMSDEKKKAVPIVAFSGSTTFQDHDLTETDIFSSIVGKPFKPLELIAKLLPYAKTR